MTCVRGVRLIKFYVIARPRPKPRCGPRKGSVRRTSGKGDCARTVRRLAALGVLLAGAAGCDLKGRSSPELVWGVHGIKPGRLHKPQGRRLRRRGPPLPGRPDRPHPGLRPRRPLPPRLADARVQRRRPQRADDRPTGPAAGGRHPLLPGPGLFAARASSLLPDRRRRAGHDARPVRLSDRRRDRQGGQLLRLRVRRERPDPGLLARGEMAPPVGRPRLRAGRVPQAPGHGDGRARTGSTSPTVATTASRSSTRRASCCTPGARGATGRAS